MRILPSIVRLGSGLLMLSAVLQAAGCAETATERRVDDKLAQEPEVKSRAQLRAEANQLIENAPGLDAAQRARLRSLRSDTSGQIEALQQESLRLRSLLIKEMASPAYNEKEVKVVKDRLKESEEKRVAIFLDAVEKANEILGRKGEVNEPIIHDIFDKPDQSED